MGATQKKSRRKRRSPKVMPKRRIDINQEAIEFKNTELLKKYVTEKGRILPRRATGMPAKLHRKLTNEIKRSRNVLLMK
jgi:small subunit ribosomal protein S18